MNRRQNGVSILKFLSIIGIAGIFAAIFNKVFSLNLNGVLHFSWWECVVAVLILTHITIVAVTIFLHRHQAHRALDMSPVLSHFFRFWLWITTGMVTKEWAAIHRKHHAKCETSDDPHSPQILGLKTVLWRGADLYRTASKNQDLLDKYGHGTPDDWLERKIYSKHSVLGIVIMLILDMLLFGAHGIWIWAVQMMWIPFWAAGVINGIGHYFGYRNFECPDAATNLVPIGILIGGEELHNNHHTFGSSAKLSNKWWEFDIGWMYIRIFEFFGLVKVRRVAPTLRKIAVKQNIDTETLQAIITNRYEIAATYAKLFRKTIAIELTKLCGKSTKLSQFQKWLEQDREITPIKEQSNLDELLTKSYVLNTVYKMRQDLTRLWERSSQTQDQLLKHLHDWCVQAEASGIDALKDFSLRLRRFVNP